MSDLDGGKWREHGTKSARKQRAESVRAVSAAIGPEREAEQAFARGIRAYRIQVLTFLSQYKIPAGYNLDTLMVGNDTVRAGYERGRDPATIAEDIARDKRWT